MESLKVLLSTVLQMPTLFVKMKRNEEYCRNNFFILQKLYITFYDAPLKNKAQFTTQEKEKKQNNPEK